jgi:hypothetical protein
MLRSVTNYVIFINKYHSPVVKQNLYFPSSGVLLLYRGEVCSIHRIEGVTFVPGREVFPIHRFEGATFVPGREVCSTQSF